MKDLETLRLQALLSIAKGEGPNHPFRGNQWTRNASRGRAAPKDPTAGSQGGGSGKAKQEEAKPLSEKEQIEAAKDQMYAKMNLAEMANNPLTAKHGLPKETAEYLKRLNDRVEEEIKGSSPSGELSMREALSLGFKSGLESGLKARTESGINQLHEQASQQLVGNMGRTYARAAGYKAGLLVADHQKFGSGKPSTPKPAKTKLSDAARTPARPLSPASKKQVAFIEEAKLSPKALEHYLSLSDKGKGVYKIWHNRGELMAELRTSQYKGLANKKASEAIREALKSKGLLGTGSTPKPASSTAPKPPKKKTAKEKDAEYDALTEKQKLIYANTPKSVTHDEAIALALKGGKK